MNKASGKLAAGVRKIKTQQKPEPAAAPAAPAPEAPRATVTEAAAIESRAGARHPDRVWPD